MGTAERKFAIVKYLCRQRRTTMAELADMFGVSIRTIQRDIVFLSGEMRIPIFCQHGKYVGGVYIDDQYKWDKMYMTQEQIDLLVKVGELVEGMLSEREGELYQQIIRAYALPTSKEFFNVDSSCPH